MHGCSTEYVLHINRPENDRRIQIFTFLTWTRPLAHISRTQVSCITIHGHCLKVFFWKTRENVSPSAAERFRFYSCVLYRTRWYSRQTILALCVCKLWHFFSRVSGFSYPSLRAHTCVCVCIFFYFIVEKRFPAFSLTGRNIWWISNPVRNETMTSGRIYK